MTEQNIEFVKEVRAENRRLEEKRLFQFPLRVRKVKRLRRQITELNRALRRLKDENVILRKNFNDAINLSKDWRITTDQWEKLYKPASDRADTWTNMAYMMGFFGLAVGAVVGWLVTFIVMS